MDHKQVKPPNNFLDLIDSYWVALIFLIPAEHVIDDRNQCKLIGIEWRSLKGLVINKDGAIFKHFTYNFWTYKLPYIQLRLATSKFNISPIKCPLDLVLKLHTYYLN